MQFDQLRRRQFITLLGGAAAWPLAALTARLMAIGRELAELCTPIEPPPSGEWG